MLASEDMRIAVSADWLGWPL